MITKQDLYSTEAEKAQKFLDNQKKNKVTWAEIAKEFDVSSYNISRYKGHPEKTKRAKWYIVHRLAQAQDKLEIEQIMGNNSAIVKQAMFTLIDASIPGTSKFDEALKDIIKNNPLAIAYLAQLVGEGHSNEKDTEESN